MISVYTTAVLNHPDTSGAVRRHSVALTADFDVAGHHDANHGSIVLVCFAASAFITVSKNNSKGIAALANGIIAPTRLEETNPNALWKCVTWQLQNSEHIAHRGSMSHCCPKVIHIMHTLHVDEPGQ
jgi:hypothetical protein